MYTRSNNFFLQSLRLLTGGGYRCCQSSSWSWSTWFLLSFTHMNSFFLLRSLSCSMNIIGWSFEFVSWAPSEARSPQTEVTQPPKSTTPGALDPFLPPTNAIACIPPSCILFNSCVRRLVGDSPYQPCSFPLTFERDLYSYPLTAMLDTFLTSQHTSLSGLLDKCQDCICE